MPTLRCTSAPLLAALLLAGCASLPEQQPAPQIALPEHWAAAESPADTEPQAWLADFEQPQLTQLVEEALAHNANLQIAAARLDQSVAEARIAGAERWPLLGLGLGAQRQRISTFGPSSTEGVRFDNFDLGLNLSWELDIWGRLRNQRNSALAQVQVSQAEWAGARLSLAAQVCKRWFDLLEAQQQLALATRTAHADSENLKILEARFQRGLSGGLELRRIRTQSASAQAQVAARQRILDASARALEILLGRYPAAQLSSEAQVLPPLPPQIPAGLPAQLLERRPDLIVAERQLAASEQSLSAARKDRLPQIRLTASTGSSSQEFRNLIERDFSAWSLGANLSQPLLQGGRISANIARSRAQQAQAVAQYRATALQAFLEVESALAAEQLLQQEYRERATAAAEAQQAEELAWQRYRNGTSDFLNALDAQRSANAAQSQMLSLRNTLLQNRIDLHLALGGPFQSAP